MEGVFRFFACTCFVQSARLKLIGMNSVVRPSKLCRLIHFTLIRFPRGLQRSQMVLLKELKSGQTLSLKAVMIKK